MERCIALGNRTNKKEVMLRLSKRDLEDKSHFEPCLPAGRYLSVTIKEN
jgi:hypothetical protein